MLSSADFAELLAAERICPRGPLRDDLRALWLAQAAVAPWQKGGGRLEPRDYFGHLFEAIPEQPVEEMIEMAKAITLSHGGEVL